MPMNVSGYLFSDLVPLTLYHGASTPGIYSVFARSALAEGPGRDLYIGETDNFAARGFPASHERYVDWLAECGLSETLWIAVLPTHGWTELQRKALERRLIELRSPICNIQHNLLSTAGSTERRSARGLLSSSAPAVGPQGLLSRGTQHSPGLLSSMKFGWF